MIVDIQKGSFIKGLINYHEKKVQEGKAQLLEDNTLSKTKNERIATFLETAELNERIQRNKFLHVSISFPKTDSHQITSEQMIAIGNRYLAEMGITDTPVLIYEHADKQHKHFHIVTTTMNYQGKKIPEFNDHYRSQVLSRALEKEFGLSKTEYVSKYQMRLMETNATKYRLYNAFAGSSQNFRQDSQAFVPSELLEEITANKLSDREIKDQLLIRGKSEGDFNQLYRLLVTNDLFVKTKKQKLRDRLEHLKQISKSRDEFINRVSTDGLYVRQIANTNNSYSLTYGDPAQNFYVKEKDLPVALRYDYLFTGKNLSLSFDKEQQRKYLRNSMQRILAKANNQDEFERLLAKDNITFRYATNARGIYGLTVSSQNVKEPVQFKASEVDRSYSWNRIAQQLNISTGPTIAKGQTPTTTEKSSTGNALKDLLKAAKNTEKASDQEERAKKKRMEEDDKDQQQSL